MRKNSADSIRTSPPKRPRRWFASGRSGPRSPTAAQRWASRRILLERMEFGRSLAARAERIVFALLDDVRFLLELAGASAHERDDALVEQHVREPPIVLGSPLQVGRD